MAELQIADVRAQVALSLMTDFKNYSEFSPADHHEQVLHSMLDQVVSWTEALAPVRDKIAVAA